MRYFTNFKDKQLMEQVHLYENDGFLDWFEHRFGEHKTQILKKISQKEQKSPYMCCNFKTQLLYLESDHSGGAWIRANI